MTRHLPLTILGLTLLSGMIACAPKTVGPTSPSGYVFSLQASPPNILRSHSYIFDDDFSLSGGYRYADLIVEVKNQQGQAVDGIPVAFEVEPSRVKNVVITPPRTLTEKGKAYARFQSNIVGLIQVVARVEDTTQQAAISVLSPGRSSVSGGDGGGGP